MTNCKVGLISFPKNKGNLEFPLFLGTCSQDDFKKNIYILYELHKHLKYISEFKLTIKDSKLYINNIEDIKHIQQKYNLTNDIQYANTSINLKILFNPPQLYDLDCMISLFTDNIPKKIIKFRTEYKKVFILLPYINPIIRGEIIDSCIKAAGNYNCVFITLGGIFGQNTISMCKLTEKYLLSLNVNPDNIIKIKYNYYPDCILESTTLLELFGIDKYTLYLGLIQEDITKSLLGFRKIKNNGLIYKKIYFISN